MDNDGITDKALKIALKMSLKRGRMTLDFSGTSAACDGPVNISRATCIAACYVALKHIFRDVPANAGVLEPIDFIIPEDSLLSVGRPKPVGGYTETILRIIDVMFVVMSKIAPDQTNGCAYGTINALSLAGHRKNGARWVMFSFLAAAMEVIQTVTGLIMEMRLFLPRPSRRWKSLRPRIRSGLRSGRFVRTAEDLASFRAAAAPFMRSKCSKKRPMLFYLAREGKLHPLAWSGAKTAL